MIKLYEPTGQGEIYGLARFVNRLINYRHRYAKYFDALDCALITSVAGVLMCAFAEHYGCYDWLISKFPSMKKYEPFDEPVYVAESPTGQSEILKKWNVWW